MALSSVDSEPHWASANGAKHHPSLAHVHACGEHDLRLGKPCAKRWNRLRRKGVDIDQIASGKHDRLALHKPIRAKRDLDVALIGADRYPLGEAVGAVDERVHGDDLA